MCAAKWDTLGPSAATVASTVLDFVACSFFGMVWVRHLVI